MQELQPEGLSLYDLDSQESILQLLNVLLHSVLFYKEQYQYPSTGSSLKF